MEGECFFKDFYLCFAFFEVAGGLVFGAIMSPLFSMFLYFSSHNTDR